MAVPSYPLDDIRARCDIVEVVSPYVALKRSGKSLKGLCPFHAEKTPSFIVNADTQRWMCFGCGEKGDVFSFIMRTEGVTFPEAVEQLAAKAGVDITHASGNTRSAGERDLVLRANNLAAVYFRKMLERSQEAQEYLRRRGVTPEAAEKFKLGYVGSEWSGLATYLRGQKVRPEDAAKAGLLVARDNDNGQWFFDLFRNRLIFPIQDVQGRVVAFGGRALAQGDVKYINSPETKAFVKNKTLYALNLARKSIVEQNSVVLVEGYMDALTAHAAGFTNVVATMGTALTPEHVRLLSRYTRSAVLAFDADSAGMSAAVRGAPMFEEAEFDVKVAPMPPGEDPDSLIRRGDRAVFAELVADALPIPDYRLRIVSGKHDVTTRAGQVALLKESIPVIAEVVSEVERERLIATLAPYHPNFRSGTTPAETHIRREIDAWRSKAAQKHPAAPKTVAANPGRVDLLSEEGKAVRKAERELLGNIICSNTRVVEVFSQIPPDAFVSEDARAVAAAVHEEFADGGTLNIDSLTVRLANTAGEGLLIELLVSVSELSATPIADLIGTIKTYRNKELEKRFRNLAEKIQRGEIKRTDKEFSEYWQLVRDLHT